jgi:hypothetical protein
MSPVDYLQFVPSRVDGLQDVSEAVVYPDRLELRSAGQWVVFRFTDIGDVLSYFKAHGNLPFQNTERASLEAALVAHHMRDGPLSVSLFAKAYATNHKGFQQHVAELARRVGQTVG